MIEYFTGSVSWETIMRGDLKGLYKRAKLIFEWELSEIKHQSHFIPYGVDWKGYFDCYPFDYLFSAPPT